MRIDSLRAVALCFLAFFAANVSAHGLVQDPPARNWFCGAITKPDHVSNGVAQYQRLHLYRGHGFIGQAGAEELVDLEKRLPAPD
jgi:predicted carbohydrate-binding protein with CBM5 and CBM33 domain